MHNLKVIEIGRSNSAYNYDFHSREVSPSNVDWPMTVLFTKNATVSKVKALYWRDHGEVKWFTCRSGDLWLWSSDEGTKSKGIRACHLRLYANDNDHCYDSQIGKYVIGSTHYDRFEGWPSPWRHTVGWSEEACQEVLSIARRKGYKTIDKMWNWDNYESGYWEGNRWCQSDGWVSVVEIP
jgi:hypothetical protein